MIENTEGDYMFRGIRCVIFLSVSDWMDYSRLSKALFMIFSRFYHVVVIVVNFELQLCIELEVKIKWLIIKIFDLGEVSERVLYRCGGMAK